MNDKDKLGLEPSENTASANEIIDFFTDKISQEEEKVYLVFDMEKADYLLSIDEVAKSVKLFTEAKFNLLSQMIEFNKPKEEVIANVIAETLASIAKTREELRAEMLTITAITIGTVGKRKETMNPDLN